MEHVLLKHVHYVHNSFDKVHVHRTLGQKVSYDKLSTGPMVHLGDNIYAMFNRAFICFSARRNEGKVMKGFPFEFAQQNLHLARHGH